MCVFFFTNKSMQDTGKGFAKDDEKIINHMPFFGLLFMKKSCETPKGRRKKGKKTMERKKNGFLFKKKQTGKLSGSKAEGASVLSRTAFSCND